MGSRWKVVINFSPIHEHGGHGNPLQYSCLENPMDGGVWQAAVQRATKNWTELDSTVHTYVYMLKLI